MESPQPLFTETSRIPTGFWEELLWTRRKLILITVSALALHTLALSFALYRKPPFDVGEGPLTWAPPVDPLTLMITTFAVANLLTGFAAIRLQKRVNAILTHSCITSAVLLAGLAYALLLPWAADSSRAFFVQGLVHILVLGHVFNLIPVKVLLPVSVCLVGLFASVALSPWGPWPGTEAVFNVQLLVSVNVVLLAAAYLLETQAKRNYALLRDIESEQQLQESQTRQRSEWLSFAAHFLRHELRNALIGVSSSLTLIRRKSTSEAQRQLIEQAEYSARRIKTLLDKAGSATAMEAEFNAADKQTLLLATVLVEAVEEAAGDIPPHWKLDLDEGTAVLAPATLLLGGLKACADYLMRVTLGESPLRIRANAEEGSVSVDFLYDEPNPAATLFEPRFDTRTPDRSPHFDLFVASRTFEAFGGQLRVLPATGNHARGLRITLPGA